MAYWELHQTVNVRHYYRLLPGSSPDAEAEAWNTETEYTIHYPRKAQARPPDIKETRPCTMNVEPKTESAPEARPWLSKKLELIRLEDDGDAADGDEAALG